MSNELIRSRTGASLLVSGLLVMLISMSLAIGLGYAVNQTLRLSFAPALTCAQLQINAPFVIESAVFDADSQQLTATIAHTPNSASSESITIRLVTSEGAILDWTCGAQCGGCTLPAPGETKTYVFDEIPSSASELAIITESCLVTSKEVS